MSEEKKIAIQNLEKYIKVDPIYNGSRENLSDFDEFCINHCLDIQIVLDLVKEQQKEIENSISKDKIREYKQKFKEDSKTNEVFMTQSSQINAGLINFCNELLEE